MLSLHGAVTSDSSRNCNAQSPGSDNSALVRNGTCHLREDTSTDAAFKVVVVRGGRGAPTTNNGSCWEAQDVACAVVRHDLLRHRSSLGGGGRCALPMSAMSITVPLAIGSTSLLVDAVSRCIGALCTALLREPLSGWQLLVPPPPSFCVGTARAGAARGGVLESMGEGEPVAGNGPLS